MVALGAAMVALVFANVVSHVFGGDVAWTTELAELMMVWVTFLGGAAATRRGAHMRITEFLDKLDGLPRRWADARDPGARARVLGLLVWFGAGHRGGEPEQHPHRARLVDGVAVPVAAGRIGG